MSNVPLTTEELGELLEYLRKNPLVQPGPGSSPREFFHDVVRPARAPKPVAPGTE